MREEEGGIGFATRRGGMASSKENGKSFFQTMPGILSGVAAVIAAVTGLLVALGQIGVFEPQPDAPPAVGGSPGATPSTSAPAGDRARAVEGRITFEGFAGTTYLAPQALSRMGVARVEAAPEGTYCSDARPVVLAKGRYQVPVNVLSTASPDEPNKCNGVPLRFVLASPAQEVKIHFSGAKTDYALRTFAANGALLGERLAQAEPYVYSTDYTVQYGAPSRVIHSFTFGRSAALTLIREIGLR